MRCLRRWGRGGSARVEQGGVCCWARRGSEEAHWKEVAHKAVEINERQNDRPSL